MRIRLFFSICVLIFLSAILQSAVADVPTLVNYQGILLDSHGNPITIPSSVRFAIYDAASGGNVKWEDTYVVTPDAEGRFNILLGSGVLPIDPEVFEGPDRWLGITVETELEMTPRVRLVTVAYAFRVATVDGAAGGNITSDVSIGPGHQQTAEYTFVAGTNNVVDGIYSSIGGGYKNVAEGEAANISGGGSNEAIGNYSFVGGGSFGKARGDYSVVVGGGGSSFADSNSATGMYSSVMGGNRNRATGESSCIGGGAGNYAEGTLSFVGGGEYDSVFSSYATIAGGRLNRARYAYAAIGGGYGNVIESNYYGTIGGGSSNYVSGEYATVPGGRNSRALEDYSFAAGRYAKAIHPGAFVWADGSASLDFMSRADNEFTARSTGGARFVTAIDGAGSPTAGVIVTAGGGSWSSLSDRNMKDNLEPVNIRSILDRLSTIPISTWNYKAQSNDIRHIGPMAQDLYAAFGFGEDDTHIATIDADGIALAAIQALHKENSELKRELAELRAMMQQLLAEKE
jgi:hypothetical protein